MTVLLIEHFLSQVREKMIYISQKVNVGIYNNTSTFTHMSSTISANIFEALAQESWADQSDSDTSSSVSVSSKASTVTKTKRPTTMKVGTSYIETQRHSRYFRTRPCFAALRREDGTYGKCTRSNCVFAHTLAELRYPICMYGKYCKKLDECDFMHEGETGEQFRERMQLEVPELPVDDKEAEAKKAVVKHHVDRSAFPALVIPPSQMEWVCEPQAPQCVPAKEDFPVLEPKQEPQVEQTKQEQVKQEQVEQVKREPQVEPEQTKQEQVLNQEPQTKQEQVKQEDPHPQLKGEGFVPVQMAKNPRTIRVPIDMWEQTLKVVLSTCADDVIVIPIYPL